MHPAGGGEVAYGELDAAACGACPAAAWVEEAHFDLGVRVEGQISGVEAHGIDVIEQQSHPDAPVCGRQDFPGKQFACYIALPIVILKIKAPPGLAGKIKPEAEGLQVVINYPDAALPAVISDFRN